MMSEEEFNAWCAQIELCTVKHELYYMFQTLCGMERQMDRPLTVDHIERLKYALAIRWNALRLEDVNAFGRAKMTQQTPKEILREFEMMHAHGVWERPHGHRMPP